MHLKYMRGEGLIKQKIARWRTTGAPDIELISTGRSMGPDQMSVLCELFMLAQTLLWGQSVLSLGLKNYHRERSSFDKHTSGLRIMICRAIGKFSEPLTCSLFCYVTAIF